MNKGSPLVSITWCSVVTAKVLRATKHVAATDVNTTVFRDVTPCAFADMYSTKTLPSSSPQTGYQKTLTSVPLAYLGHSLETSESPEIRESGTYL